MRGWAAAGSRSKSGSTGSIPSLLAVATQTGTAATPARLMVSLPAGGTLELNSPEEVELWENAAKRYIEDYGFVKANDLILLGAILSQTIAMYRAQQQLSDSSKANAAIALIGKASEQIRELEKALGVDKKTREAGGQHTVADYITRLKRAAHVKGVHISDRTKAYEQLAMDMRWKIRVLRNGDDEDRRHHGISEKKIIDELEKRLAELEEKDREWAKDRGRVFVGKL